MTGVPVEIPDEVCGVSALSIIGGVGHFYGAQYFEPRVIRRFVELAEQDGLLEPAIGSDSYAVLDLLDPNGDIVSDRHVPTAAAWAALNSELRLSVVAIEGASNG